jgi:hypothetical protein
MSVELLLAFIAIFLGVKAVEYRGDPQPIYAICSYGAWIAFAVCVILALVR